MKTPSLLSWVPGNIAAIAPYQGGKSIQEIARAYGLNPNTIIKLASNENPLGMSPLAQAAITEALSALSRYPDSNGHDLKVALANQYCVPTNWITLGNGSNDILEMVTLALLTPAVAAVYSQYAFAVYRLATQARGARHIVVPAVDYGHDLDAMLTAIESDTRLVFIANPNNPTGTFLPPKQIESFLHSVYDRYGLGVTVVLDEAYNEYLDPEWQFDSASWVRQFPNLILSRTFSKAYGLAGLRVGFALAQSGLTDMLNRVRQPFNVHTLAQKAAIAALTDFDFLKKTYCCNQVGKQQLYTAFESLNLKYLPSFGNFVTVHIKNVSYICEALLKQGIIVRPLIQDNLPEWIRVSVGLFAENEAFIHALSCILSQVR